MPLIWSVNGDPNVFVQTTDFSKSCFCGPAGVAVWGLTVGEGSPGLRVALAVGGGATVAEGLAAAVPVAATASGVPNSVAAAVSLATSWAASLVSVASAGSWGGTGRGRQAVRAARITKTTTVDCERSFMEN